MNWRNLGAEQCTMTLKWPLIGFQKYKVKPFGVESKLGHFELINVLGDLDSTSDILQQIFFRCWKHICHQPADLLFWT